jgi:DNA-binding LytR/AlgR family response regulator
MSGVTALLAEDEPILRERLAAMLARAWPGLEIVAQARHGREAVELFEQHQPQVAFLDIHMPGLNGIEVARAIGTRAALVFVTAFDQYAVEAFARGAIDYLLKPVEEERLAETVQRLQARLAGGSAPPSLEETLERLAARLGQPAAPRLRWIRASVGDTVRLIPVDQVAYLKADHKYTLVVWQGGEGVIRTSIKELSDQLDPDRFARIHRSAIVNLAQVASFVHGNDAGEIQLHGRPERLPVSRSFVHLFQRM